MIKVLDRDEWYLRQAAIRALLRGEPALPLDPESEPSNVHSIEAARTRRATTLMMRGRAMRERPL
jgi:hypothetical protein